MEFTLGRIMRLWLWRSAVSTTAVSRGGSLSQDQSHELSLAGAGAAPCPPAATTGGQYHPQHRLTMGALDHDHSASGQRLDGHRVGEYHRLAVGGVDTETFYDEMVRQWYRA